MKSGTCPKCGSGTVHTRVGGLSFGNMDRIFIDSDKMHEPSTYTAYVCVTCGYFENYLTGTYLPQVVEQWAKVPVRG